MQNSIVFEYPLWLIIFCVVSAFGYAFILYFRDKKLSEISKKTIWLLAILRFFATLIISALLLSPLLKSVGRTIEKPIIVFAIDNSESIKLAYKNNKKELTKIQNEITNAIGKINKKYQVETFSFGAKLNDTLTFDYTEKQTDIAQAILLINNKLYNKNIGVVILLSDGIFNKGNNPLYSTDNLNSPIYTIAVGDSTINKDIAINKVEHNEITYLNSKFPIQVTINAKKFKGNRGICKISYKGKTIASQEYNINSDNFVTKLKFEIEAKKAGIHRYTISTTKIKDEKNIINNTKTVAINVIGNKQKILIIANSPHPDIGAIKNSLSRNDNYKVELYSTEKFAGKISEYSLIILHQLPSATNGLNNIFPQIIKFKIPILFVVGTQTDLTKFNSLNLGIKINQKNIAFDNVNAYKNPNFLDFEVSEPMEKLLADAPPIIAPFANYNIAANTNVILYQKIKNVQTTNPLCAIAKSNTATNAPIGFFIGENIWRIRMYEYKKATDFDKFDNFWFQIIQALVLKINKQRIIVKTKKIVHENQEIIFDAQVYNKIYELENKNNLELKISDSTNKSFEYFFSKTDKAYKLNIGTMPEGNYKYVAKTQIGKENLKTSGELTVIKTNIEAANIEADYEMLDKLATKTGGKLLERQNLDSIDKYIENIDNITDISYENQDIDEIIKFKWIFFLIISILTLEWVLRKIFGTH